VPTNSAPSALKFMNWFPSRYEVPIQPLENFFDAKISSRV
jgi:hypothetical protein